MSLEITLKSCCALIATFSLASSAQQLPGTARDIAEMEPLLVKIAAFEYGQSRESWAQLTLFVEQSLTSPALVRKIETRLLRFLQTPGTAAGKEIAFRELSLIASDASVPVLAGMLLQQDMTEMARFALTRIPGPGADEALRKAVEKTTGNTRIGIINSLGQRRDGKSVSLLKSLLASDPPIIEAAAAALADISNLPALDALSRARTEVPASLRQRVSEAYLQAAGRLAFRGDKNGALKVYKELLSPTEPEMVRVAALKGLAETGGRNALPALAAELGSSNSRMESVAIRALSGIEGADVTAMLIARFPKLTTPGQIRLLTALADRGDKKALPLFITAVKDPSAEIRTAALSGLGKLGDSSSVILLAETAASGQGAEQVAARQSLARLRGPAIDATVAAAIGSADKKLNVELIRAAGERGISTSADALAKSIHHQDPDVRRESMKALRSVAGPAQVELLVNALLQASNAVDRKEATQTLAAALKRTNPMRMDAVAAAYKNTSSIESRVALLEAIGQISNDNALAMLRSALSDPAPEIARAAILAMSDWSSPTPLPDLMRVAQTSSSPVLQVLSLRGCLKLLALPSQRSSDESARLLVEAMRLAQQPAEKKIVLSLLPAYASEEALRLAQAALGDETVAREARVALNRINSVMKVQ